MFSPLLSPSIKTIALSIAALDETLRVSRSRRFCFGDYSRSCGRGIQCYLASSADSYNTATSTLVSTSTDLYRGLQVRFHSDHGLNWLTDCSVTSKYNTST